MFVYMSRFLALLALAVVLSAPIVYGKASASTVESGTSCRGAVSWLGARGAIGRYATIKGPVAGTRYVTWANGSPTFINLGQDYPSPQRVQIVIWQENRGRFGAPERRYRGHTLCVHGLVKNYRGTPEIEATQPSQITIAR